MICLRGDADYQSVSAIAISIPSPGIVEDQQRRRRLRTAPGAVARYTNLGYLVLGEVVAAVSGMPYE